MARETFGTLTLQAQNYVQNAQTTSTTNLSDIQTFLKKEINLATRELFTLIRGYKTQPPPKTTTTVADQQYYHYPPGVDVVENVKITIGSVIYPMETVNSQLNWDLLNQVEFNGAVRPQFIFPRRDDFGIWPTPSTAGYTITFDYNPIPKDMTAADYTTGTVVTTQNDATVTGTNTTFTAGMVGRWFKADDDGDWYRIGSFSTTTSLELESVFEGSAVSGGTYVIGESPELPVELHGYIPAKATGVWMATYQREFTMAQNLMNYYYTGDFNNSSRNPRAAAAGVLYHVNRYRSLGRDNSALVHKRKVPNYLFDDRWVSTIT